MVIKLNPLAVVTLQSPSTASLNFILMLTERLDRLRWTPVAVSKWWE
jgi:hypothetical protein